MSNPVTDWSDLSQLLDNARATATGAEAEEIEPGVMLAEAKVCVFHAVVVQGGAATVEIEAKRLSKDRRGNAPQIERIDASRVSPPIDSVERVPLTTEMMVKEVIPPPPPTFTLEQALTPIALALAAIQEHIAIWQDEERSLKAQIRTLTEATGPDSYQAGGYQVVVSTNRRYDAAKAMNLIADDLLRPLVVETVEQVNKAKLKALAPHLFDQAQVYGDLRVALR